MPDFPWHWVLSMPGVGRYNPDASSKLPGQSIIIEVIVIAGVNCLDSDCTSNCNLFNYQLLSF